MKLIIYMFIMLISAKECDKNKTQLASENSSDVTVNKNEGRMKNDTLSGKYTVDILDSESITDALTLEFDETTNKVSGFSGCNRFFGTYKTDGNSITFSQMGSTKKYCQEKANTIEEKFLKALSKVNMFSLEDNNLSLQADKETLVIANQDDSSKMMQESDVKITYLAVSRGFHLSITVDGDSITYSNDRNIESAVVHDIPKEEKDTLRGLISDLDETTLPELEAPSTAHQYDGAAIATLEATYGEDTYKTIAFDHGNPPESIKAIVEKMLSIKTIIEKQ